MEAAKESIEPRVAPPMPPGAEGFGSGAEGFGSGLPVGALDGLPVGAVREDPHVDGGRRLRGRARRLPLSLGQLRFAVSVYLGSRILLFAVGLLDRELRHQSLVNVVSNWDGMWLRELAHKGYPTHVVHGQSTLGFFPLYPLVMWAVGHVLTAPSVRGITFAGVIVSEIGGLITTMLVQRLATGWWGPDSGRRATLLFCLFPGSIVFSMVYGEGLLLPLAAGCLLALGRRRFVLAGVLAGFATAVQPDALALVPVCAASAFLDIRRHGWRDRSARRSLLAPLLSLTGIVAFAAFLWAWTGTPLATYEGQHHGWGERTDPLALVNQAQVLVGQISFTHFNHPTINLNLPVGLLGAAVLIAGVALLARRRNSVSPEALVWTLAIGFLAITSENVSPNPRLLITAFPAVLVFAHRYRGKAGAALLVVNGVLLAGMSFLTFVGPTLRP